MGDVDILRGALEAVLNAVNNRLSSLEAREEEWVSMTNLVDHGGALNPIVRNKVVMCVYNFSREPAARSLPTPGVAAAKPPLHLDVHLIFMANFAEKNYPEGLSALSRIIAHFQQSPVLIPSAAPSLPLGVGKLTMEMESLGATDVNFVMSMLGTRYLPSVFYKLRMIPFAAEAMSERGYAVGAPKVERPGSSAA